MAADSNKIQTGLSKWIYCGYAVALGIQLPDVLTYKPEWGRRGKLPRLASL